MGRKPLAAPASTAIANETQDVAELLELYRSMLLIRAVELEIERLHRRGAMTGSFHSSMGQEACAAGVCAALRTTDLVTSNHRGHGHAIAKGVAPAAILGELHGRRTGTSGGRGGSMHLHDRSVGFYGETAIVGGSLPWAAGAAWARRRRGGDDVGVAFLGDGAFATGTLHETLRLAQYWGSPCLFVCENNGWAHSMPSERLFGEPGAIAKMVAATGMRSEFVHGRDADAVLRLAHELVGYVREGQPAFLECEVYRVRPHSLSDADYRYRPKEAGAEWLEANDPIARLRAVLEPVAAEALGPIEAEVIAAVADAGADAEAAERTDPSEAVSHIYATEALNHGGAA